MTFSPISDLLAPAAGAAAEAGLLHGLVAAVGDGEAPPLFGAWGAASVLPERVPMRVDALFDLASLTKVVATTSACALCIDRGLLDPDAPVAAYLPSIGQFEGQTIRVRDLATHCSGYDNGKFDALAPEQFFDAVVQRLPRWPPGQNFEYSCRNFILLGLIVEQVTREGLASFCERNLFAPLGMKDTRFGPLPAGNERVVPTEQPAGTISDEQARKAPRPVGNAGLFSTAGDLAIFCRMILRGGRSDRTRIFQEQSLRWLTRACTPAGLPRRSFGWDMRPCSECVQRPVALSDAAIGHGGWTGQTLWIDPVQDRYVIILTNRTHAPGNAENYEPSNRFRAMIGDLLLAHWSETR